MSMMTKEEIKLRIVPARGDKHSMVGFEGPTTEVTAAYNYAIEDVLMTHGMSPFHQVGVSPLGPNNPGYHAWEVWSREWDLSTALFDEIEKVAKSYL